LIEWQSAFTIPAFMRLLCWIAIVLLWSLADSLIPSVLAEPIQLRPAMTINDGGAALCPGNLGQGYAIPCVTDWNGDGKKDLLVGYQLAGKIALYLNLGTDAQPCFTNHTNLKTGDGSDIYHPSSGCGAPAPWVCDFDGDGKRDLLVGAGSDGTVWFYRNTNTDAAPILAPGVQLKTGANNLTVGIRATPCVTDWDEDGLNDLLCGNGDGYVYFFKNTNAGQASIFAPGVKIQAGGVDLNLGIRSVVRVFDWDGDGLKDLVCSSDTGVYWCRNTNSNSQPILQAKASLQAPSSTTGKLVNINTGGRMRLDLVDWNNDGVMDLILGNLNGTVSYYEGYYFHIHLTRQTNNTIALQWDSAPFLKYNVLAYDCPDGIPCLAVTNLPSGGNTTIWTNQIQGDQQFFRVQIAQ
jgi:FG-GAP-like repeat